MMIAAIVLVALMGAFCLFDWIRSGYVSYTALGLALGGLGFVLFFIALIHNHVVPSGV